MPGADEEVCSRSAAIRTLQHCPARKVLRRTWTPVPRSIGLTYGAFASTIVVRLLTMNWSVEVCTPFPPETRPTRASLARVRDLRVSSETAQKPGQTFPDVLADDMASVRISPSNS